MIVLRWAFGHSDSTDSSIEVPDADVGRAWAGLHALMGEHIHLEGEPVITEEALGAAVRRVGPAWVAEHFSGLASLDADQWWKFLATGSFHGGLAATAPEDHVQIGAAVMKQPSPGSDNRLRVGTWNLDRDKPLWRKPHQAEHISQQAEVWMLTEVPANWQLGAANSSLSGLRPHEDDQYWSAIFSCWPMEAITATHPSLAMARICHPDGDFLAASSVLPWRGAAKYWPAADGDTFAERCANTLDAHAAEICEARCGLPVVWGGDFNQALSGRDYVGSDVGREALSKAFKHLGLRAVTIEAAGQELPHRSIDHIAIPMGWRSAEVEVQRPQPEGRFLSDHPSYVVSVERAVVSTSSNAP